MEFEVSPQGIMTALIVVAVAVLAYVNRSTLSDFLPKRSPEKPPADHGEGHVTLLEEIHVLDVMKTLTEINEREQLGCEDELKAIYAKIVTHRPSEEGK